MCVLVKDIDDAPLTVMCCVYYCTSLLIRTHIHLKTSVGGVT